MLRSSPFPVARRRRHRGPQRPGDLAQRRQPGSGAGSGARPPRRAFPGRGSRARPQPTTSGSGIRRAARPGAVSGSSSATGSSGCSTSRARPGRQVGQLLGLIAAMAAAASRSAAAATPGETRASGAAPSGNAVALMLCCAGAFGAAPSGHAVALMLCCAGAFGAAPSGNAVALMLCCAGLQDAAAASGNAARGACRTRLVQRVTELGDQLAHLLGVEARGRCRRRIDRHGALRRSGSSTELPSPGSRSRNVGTASSAGSGPADPAGRRRVASRRPYWSSSSRKRSKIDRGPVQLGRPGRCRCGAAVVLGGRCSPGSSEDPSVSQRRAALETVVQPGRDDGQPGCSLRPTSSADQREVCTWARAIRTIAGDHSAGRPRAPGGLVARPAVQVDAAAGSSASTRIERPAR